jgi:hypothetical protein
MANSSRYFFSICVLTASMQGLTVCNSDSEFPRYNTDQDKNTPLNNADALNRKHFGILEIFAKVIGVLRANRELKCTVEEKVLVNRILDSIDRSLSKKAISETNNRQIAHKLRRVLQILGLSSRELDDAQGASLYEETDAIIIALQTCFAERNLTPFHRKFRTLVNTIEPYKSALVISTFPFVCYLAFRLNDTMQKAFVKAVELDIKGTTPTKTLPSSSYTSDSWELFSQALIIPAVGIMYKYVDTTIFKNALERASDHVRKVWAQLQGLPAGSSNPASSSRVALKDIPAPEIIKTHMQALARMTISQEEVFKQQGGAGLKTLLIHGDTSLAQLIALGLADEVVRLAREKNINLTCPVATIHASKLAKIPLRDILEKIVTYNKSCIIVRQDLDWIVDTEVASTIISEIINGIKSITKLHEQYIVIGTARNIADVDWALKQPSIFGTRFMISPVHDARLLNACIERAEKVYGINIRRPELRAQLESYICSNSFGDFMNLFAAAYTKSLPQVCATLTAFDEDAIVRELALVNPTYTNAIPN